MLAFSKQSSRRAMVVLHAAETGIGGINSIILGLGASQVAQFGPGSVHVLVPRDHAADYAGTSLVPHVFERRTRSLRACLAFTYRLAALVLSHRPPFVVLHSTFAGVAGRLALLALWPLHRPIVIYCAHGWAFNMAVSGLRKRVYADVERGLARLASAIVNVSDAEHAAALGAGLPSRRLHCIPNGTPRAGVEPGPDPYPPRPGVVNLLFVGRLDRQKGVDVLLDVLSRAAHLPLHLTVVGSAIVEEAGLRRLPNVTFVPWLPRAGLTPYYAYADALIVPSRWEGMPLVAAEALSFGTPVIASRVGGLASLIEHGVSGFLFRSDAADELFAILSRLDRETLGGMRVAAFQRWERAANLDVMNRRYLELMQTLASRHGALASGRQTQSDGTA